MALLVRERQPEKHAQNVDHLKQHASCEHSSHIGSLAMPVTPIRRAHHRCARHPVLV
jgi:hypothetical protein